MADIQDLWQSLAALKTSIPFVIALPILIATVFASIVDWLEGYLADRQDTPSQYQSDDLDPSVRQRQSGEVSATSRPAFEGGNHLTKTA
jgi:hypothetical protein